MHKSEYVQENEILKNLCDFELQTEKTKRDEKYLDLARKLKKPSNLKVTVIVVIIGKFGKVLQMLKRGREEFEIGGRAETIQTTAVLRSARILR